MLSPSQLEAASAEVKFLTEQVLRQEKFLLTLAICDTFPVLPVRVPDEYAEWIHEYPAEVFYVSFEEIFNMLHLYRLDSSLLRLWALHLTSAIITDKIEDIVIADPYLMFETTLRTNQGRRSMLAYSRDFMVANQDKSTLLLPYCPL